MLVKFPDDLDESANFDFLVGRSDPDDPFNLLDILSVQRFSLQYDTLPGAETVEDDLRGSDTEGSGFPSFGFPFCGDVAEYFGDPGVAYDSAEGGEGARDVELVGAGEETEEGGEVRREERLEGGGKAREGADHFEGRSAESGAFGGELER